jgi:hypothetical protein
MSTVSTTPSIKKKHSEVISSMDSSTNHHVYTVPLSMPVTSPVVPPIVTVDSTLEPAVEDLSCTAKESETSLSSVDFATLLLMSGEMPLFPPARRDWEKAAGVTIPLTGPITVWPPADWKTMSADTKLLLWQTVATSLSIQWGLPLDRHFILDAFQFLALPGTKEVEIVSPEARLRHANFTTIRNIAQKKQVVGAESLIAIYEAGYHKSFSAQPGHYRDFLQSLNHIPIRI